MSAAIPRKVVAYRAVLHVAQFVDKHYPFLRSASLAKIIERLSPCRHSPDFRSVNWLGTAYEFSIAQSRVIKPLWKAWENGTPQMGSAALLEAAGMVSDKLSVIFQGHEAWGTMIRYEEVSDEELAIEKANKIKRKNRGIYWLSVQVI